MQKLGWMKHIPETINQQSQDTPDEAKNQKRKDTPPIPAAWICRGCFLHLPNKHGFLDADAMRHRSPPGSVAPRPSRRPAPAGLARSREQVSFWRPFETSQKGGAPAMGWKSECECVCVCVFFWVSFVGSAHRDVYPACVGGSTHRGSGWLSNPSSAKGFANTERRW